MSDDIVTRLEKKIDELLSRQHRLARENARLSAAHEAFLDERKRCRRELDSILAKLDRIG